MMRKLRDVMRVFAWLCVIVGLATTREAVWIQRELSSQNAARLRRLIRDIDEEVRPAGVIVSPWPGVVVRVAADV